MKIKDIRNWFDIAIPNPTKEQACIQIGCHYEEVAEMFEVTGDMNEHLDTLSLSGEYKLQYVHHMNLVTCMSNGDKIDLLDSLADQIVTAIGVAHMMGFDIEGALEEVNRSNHSKFEDGKAVFDEDGKITKGKHYTGPQLQKFIGK